MLTNADRQIIIKDKNLPGLIALLDAETLLAELRALPQLQHIVQIDIQYLRYKPDTSCTSTVKAIFKDGSLKYYYAKALTKTRFEQSWNHPKRQKLVHENNPLAPLAIFELYIMLLHPSHDRGIRHLGWLTQTRLQQQLLNQCALTNIKDDDLVIDILRYKPERRLIAKICKNNLPLAIVRCSNVNNFSKMLTGAAFGASQGNIKIMAIDGSICTVITNWQNGHSLCPERGFLPSNEIIIQLAQKLSRIHHANYKHPISYSIDDEIQALQRVSYTFQYILPEYAEWFLRLIHQIKQGFSYLPPVSTLIHGDFSLDQVIQYNNNNVTELYILDWDRSVCGNPLMDLASLQARLELQIIEGILSFEQANNLIDTFLQGYQKETESNLDGLKWFVAAAMLRLSVEPFRKRINQWPEYTLQLLQRVEEILNQTNNLQGNIHKESIGLSYDPILYTLTDRVKMQTLFTELLSPTEQGIIASATLTRYKIQRRALIEYEINTPHGKQYIIGKYRNKGVDQRSFTIQQTLWQEGFNDIASISVPEPLAMLPEQKMWLQRKIDGQNIGYILTPDNKHLAFLGQSVANALTALHKSTVAKKLNLPCWTATQELQILHNRLTKVQLSHPKLSARIATILANCEKLAKEISYAPPVSIHRDFYQDQILVRNGRSGHMVLLDLDLLCQGPAALDAGNYLAHVIELAVRKHADILALKEHQSAFINTFLKYSTTANIQDINIYTTLSLARHIYLSTQFKERQHTTEILLTICEQRLCTYSRDKKLF